MEETISYEDAVKVGIREGIKYIKEQEFIKTKKRYDRRLRNTSLLLKNYRKLIIHSTISAETTNKINEDNAIDMLDDIQSIDDEEQYVQAITRTKKRTLVIIQHINRCLKYYKTIAKEEGSLRKYEIIKKLFIENNKDKDKVLSYEEVAEMLDISVRTVSRDVKDATKDLSVLFFGVDGIKL